MNKTITSKEYQERGRDQGRREKHQGAAGKPLGGGRKGSYHGNPCRTDRICAGKAGDGRLMEFSKKWLLGSGIACVVLTILCAFGLPLVEITLAVIAETTASSGFYLWKAKNENRSKYALKYIKSLPETYTAEEKARFLEIVLKD